MRARAAALVGSAIVAIARPSPAFTYESAVSDGCHEAIAAAALRGVRASGLAPAIEATADERALIDDLPFALPGDVDDLGGATLLLAVRDNDLKGRHPTDTDQLALVHGDPAFQREHCLRAPSHDEPSGSRAALDDCVAFLRATARGALRGLDAEGRPDPTDRVHLTVWLAFRGEATPELPRFYVRMGQALHTLEDAFTHTIRSPDATRVRVVLNWIDSVQGDLDEARDGPPHMRELDRCDDPDALRTRRRELATEASRALLVAALEGFDDADREAAIDAVLAKYLGFEEGCTYDNGWCDAPELAYRDATCGCRYVGAERDGGWAAALAGACAATIARRRRRRL
jgi:hypothetical protein